MKKILYLSILLGAYAIIPFFAYAQEANTVTVVWDQSLTHLVNTNPNDTSSGKWHVQFASKGMINRTQNQEIFLVMGSSTGQGQKKLCAFGSEYSSNFGVQYPSCATGSQTMPQNINGVPVFEAGKQYSVFFTDATGTVLNEPVYMLPAIPAPVVDGTSGNGVTIDSVKVVAHPNGKGSYYRVEATVASTSSVDLSFELADGAGNPIGVTLGSFSGKNGVLTLPTVPPSSVVPVGTYKLLVKKSGDVILTNNLPEITALDQNSANNPVTTTTGFGSIFSETQQNILSGGIVLTDDVNGCGYNIKTTSNPDGTGRMCGLGDIIKLIQRIIEYIFILVLPIVAIVFVYVGFLYITSGGDTGKHTKAKQAMTNLGIGILVVLAAWLIVKSILTTLGVDTGIASMFLDLTT